MPDTLTVPDFAHPEKFSCGPHCARFILEAHGLTWKSRLPRAPLLAPTFPDQMQQMLYDNGLLTKRVNISTLYRIDWLFRRLRHGNTPALFVRRNASFPFPAHWIVVCGMSAEGDFLAYDDRIGAYAKDLAFPIGNTVLSSREIEEIWRPFFGNTCTSVVTV